MKNILRAVLFFISVSLFSQDEKRLALTKQNQLEDKKKKRLADFVIYSDRGKRYVNNMVYNLLNKSYTAKIRSKNMIIFNFKK